MMNRAQMTVRVDASRPGTAIHRWNAALAERPRWTPPPGPLVVVAAHPDNECLGAGGLMYTWVRAGHPVTVISVTNGEAAQPRWRTLPQLRQQELKNALRELGGESILVVRLGSADGKLKLEEDVLRPILAELTSGATIISPFERDGHPDNEVVGRLCREIAADQGLAVARYPIWAWHHSTPATLNGYQFGRFPLSVPAQHAKARALRCFRSQLQARNGAAALPYHILRYFEGSEEAFVL
jgi:LmbE family N-acetylglucosaminyl deacetylase